jgi:hypothetical protein
MIFLQDDESKQQFMVDTGAVCSVLPYRSKSPPTGPQLSGADGKAILCWGTIRRCLSFGLRTFFVTFLLAAIYRPILGLDFLSAHGLLVDPVGRQVPPSHQTEGPNSHPLFGRTCAASSISSTRHDSIPSSVKRIGRAVPQAVKGRLGVPGSCCRLA